MGLQAPDTCPLEISLVQEIRYKLFTSLSPCCFGSINDILALHRQTVKEPLPGLDQQGFSFPELEKLMCFSSGDREPGLTPWMLSGLTNESDSSHRRNFSPEAAQKCCSPAANQRQRFLIGQSCPASKESSCPLCCFQKLHKAQTDGAFKKATREATSTA